MTESANLMPCRGGATYDIYRGFHLYGLDSSGTDGHGNSWRGYSYSLAVKCSSFAFAEALIFGDIPTRWMSRNTFAETPRCETRFRRADVEAAILRFRRLVDRFYESKPKALEIATRLGIL